MLRSCLSAMAMAVVAGAPACTGSRVIESDVDNLAGAPGVLDTTEAAGGSQAGLSAPDVSAPRDLRAGGYFTCALTGGGAVKCWGENAYGDLGQGDGEDRGDAPGEMGDALPAVDLGAGRTAVAIAAGFAHVCAVLDDGAVKCWGHNSVGQLGLGDDEDRGDAPGEMGDALPAVDLGVKERVVSLAAGADHTCALFEGGQIKCWGFNYSGQLGLGDDERRGDAPGQMGSQLPFVNLGDGRRARAISAGGSHTCALLENGSVKCWGENLHGELGLGDHQDRGISPDQMGDDLPEVDLGPGSRALLVSAGWEYTCIHIDGGGVRCWGHNDYGQLGLGDTQTCGDDPGEMGSGLADVDLGQGLTAHAVAAGIGHTCALTSGGPKCWGNNEQGRLGLGDTKDRGDEPGEMGDALPFVDLGKGLFARVVRPGAMHTCALVGPAGVKCWGNNHAGQLGLGDAKNRGDEQGEMGDALPFLDLGSP